MGKALEGVCAHPSPRYGLENPYHFAAAHCFQGPLSEGFMVTVEALMAMRMESLDEEGVDGISPVKYGGIALGYL